MAARCVCTDPEAGMDTRKAKRLDAMIRFQPWHRDAILALQSYYWQPGGPSGTTPAELAELIHGEWKLALAEYYGRFAYERAGANPQWARCARELLVDWPGDSPDESLSAWAWRELQRRLGKTEGLNPHNNALYPDQSGRYPVTSFVRELAEDHYNLVAWAVRLLSTGRADEATTRLLSLHGVGPKIAAFFLRDMLVAAGIAEGRIGGAHLVQPIDVWVRRAVVHLTGDERFASGSQDPRAMRRMVGLAAELDVPGAALNCALWVLGARLARSETALKLALADRVRFSKLVAGAVCDVQRDLDALRASFGEFAPPLW